MSYLIVVVILVLGAVGFTLLQSQDNSPAIEPVPVTQETVTPPQTPVETTPETQVVSDPVLDTVYTDGTYTTEVTYQTPARSTYGVGVSLTLKNDIVTDATVTYSQGAEKDPNAKRFEDAYKTEVIGKKLDEISLSRVGGASLTTGAFNKALIAIKTDARG
jgi:hypothetical protein